MKFILYSINYAPELTGIGKYNGELATVLPNHGVVTNVVTAPPYYPEWQVHAGFENRYSTAHPQAGLTVYRNPLYVPAKVTTLKRLLHLGSFALSSFGRLLTMLRQKPDVLFLVQPTLFCAPFALLYAKLVGAKTILHIQDYEIDAMFGLGMASDGGFKKVVSSIERFLMNRFDKVSSISFSMLDNAKRKGVPEHKLMFFPNWSDTKFVHPDIDTRALRAQWGYQPDDKIVLYSGNLGQKQGLEIVLDAAKALVDQPKVKFIIIGSGAYRETLEHTAAQLGLTNIEFKPLQAWELVPQILVMADVHLVVQKKGVADAVLPSKLTNILAAGGHALVTAEAHTELGKIAGKYPGIYQLVEPEQPHDFIAALRGLLQQNTQQTNQIARDYAVDNINSDKVIQRFVEDLKNLVNKE